ncbi:MAG TPA: hypothetical protein PKV98_04550 [Burkholderiaceae bacterium]|nr:hypothetical protein [Burkholderiaceae bacterium]
MLGYGVKETTTTTGTGTLTLSSVSGYPRFSQAFAVGALVEYSILNSAGEPLEMGIGTVAASNTLARTFPMVTFSGGTYSNNAPSALSLSAGTYTVICTGSPASRFPFIPGFYASGNKMTNSAHMITANGLTCAMTTNRLFVHPFLHVTNRPFAGIGCRVSTGAGTSGTLGLYSCGTDGLPGDLLQSGTINTASSGIVRTISFSAWYPPGWYFMALVCDNTPSINQCSTVPASATPLGMDSTAQIITALYTANGSISLPNPYNASGATQVVNSGSTPTIFAVYG